MNLASTRSPPPGAFQKRSLRPGLSFILLNGAMFLNFVLAFLHARGAPTSSSTVIVVQVIVTALAIPAVFTSKAKLQPLAIFAIGFLCLSLFITNILNTFNLKTVYDCFIIPIFISLGVSASYVRPRWMNYILLFVLTIVLLEIFAPSLYVSLFDPAGYLAATREWIGEKAANDSSEDGFYTGAYRAGGSWFAFADHRVGGPFLEPLSLGYFAFIMSTYYAALHRGSFAFKIFALVICVVFALASDSRIPLALIGISTVILIFRIKMPVIVLWLTFPVVIMTIYCLYLGQFSFLYGDMFTRISITFDALRKVDIGQILVGIVPLDRVGDSGILYMLRCVGLFGMPVAIWFYSGAFHYRRGTNVAFFVMISVYLTVTLMFGGASLSIKTGSLLGYLVGLAAVVSRRVTDDENQHDYR